MSAVRMLRCWLGAAVLVGAVSVMSVRLSSADRSELRASPSFRQGLVEALERSGKRLAGTLAPVPTRRRALQSSDVNQIPSDLDRHARDQGIPPRRGLLATAGDRGKVPLHGSVEMVELLGSASPTDQCDGQWQGPPTFIVPNTLVGGEVLAVYQDPEEIGCINTYPFGVTDVVWVLQVYAATTIEFQAVIYESTGPASCPIPGAIICTGPVETFDFESPGGWGLVIPLDNTCCVDGPYFAGIVLPNTYGPGVIDLVSDDGILPRSCRSYLDDGSGWVDFVDGLDYTENMSLWSQGLNADQNMCPAPPIVPCDCPCNADPRCDGVTNVFDVVHAVNVAFRGYPSVRDPDCPAMQTDVDCTGFTDVFDVVRFIEVAFRGGDPEEFFCKPCVGPILRVAAGDGEVTVFWEEDLEADSYNLYSATEPGITRFNYSTISGGTQVAGVTSPFTLSGLSNGTRNYFVATTVYPIGESDESPEVSTIPGITQIPGQPNEFVNDLIPTFPFPEPHAADFAIIDGIPISINTILLIYEDNTTVQEANAHLQNLNSIISGGIPDMALLHLRVPDMSAPDMESLINQLQTDPLVAAAVMNLGGMSNLQLPPHNITPDLWTWEPWAASDPPINGNWGLKMIRAPQLWNLHDYVQRLQAQSEYEVCAGVLEYGSNLAETEGGFEINHPDGELNFDANTPDGDDDHATHVCGIIGAVWNNNTGVEGVTPWLKLTYARYGVRDILGSVDLTSCVVYTKINQILGANSCVKVLNFSCGYYTKPGDGAPSLTVMTFAGDVARAAIDQFATRNRGDFFIVCAAGNGGRKTEALRNSAFANAAVSLSTPRAIAVESIDNMNRASSFSTLEGNISAPGSCIRSTEAVEDPTPLNDEENKTVGCTWKDDGTTPPVHHERYATLSGSSMAAPFVSGLVAALWQLDPTLKYNEIAVAIDDRFIGVSTTGGTRARVDAFAAAMYIDEIQENKVLQRALVDVSDGSMDGNSRLDVSDENGDNIFSEPYELVVPGGIRGDGRRGDGIINMQDFRAFRDALLQARVETDPEYRVELDGAAVHFKKDLNYDGCVVADVANPPHPPNQNDPAGEPLVPIPSDCAKGPLEGVYPRYDFNGDGTLDAEGMMMTPLSSGVEPFKIDPNDICNALAINPDHSGCLRDIDVLADPELWTADKEQVFVTPDVETGPPPSCPSGKPFELWTPKHNLLKDRDGDGIIDYVHSADLHFRVYLTGLPPLYDYDNADLRVESFLAGDLLWQKCYAIILPGTPPSDTVSTLILTVPIYGEGDIRIRFKAQDLDGTPPLPPIDKQLSVNGGQYGSDHCYILKLNPAAAITGYSPCSSQ